MTDKKHILAYVGDYYHEAELARAALEGSLEALKTEGAIKLLFAAETDEFIALLTQKPAAAVLFAENRIDPTGDSAKMWMDEKQAADIVRYVEDGGGWLAWHSGLASYPEDGAYVSLLRGQFLSHPAEHQVVRYEPAGHSSFAAVPFELLDEHYFTACKEAETEVYLRSSSIDGSSIAGWRHTAGSGRVCCLTPAHRKEGLLNKEFLDVLKASVCWTAGL